MKRISGLVMMAAAVQFCGCGGGIDKDADPNEAETALRTALDAWKAGKTPEDLQNQTPSIIMNELDWRNGKRLIDYKMGDKSSMHGRQVRWEVDITVQDKSGNKRDQKAKYVIDTLPRIVIVRDDQT